MRHWMREGVGAVKPLAPPASLTCGRHRRRAAPARRRGRGIVMSGGDRVVQLRLRLRLRLPGDHGQPKNSSLTWGSVMQIKYTVRYALRRSVLLASLGFLSAIGTQAEAADAFLPRVINSSTVPANGDVNPYGVAFVPAGFPAGGKITAGDVLVSNFNNSGNLQGEGT